MLERVSEDLAVSNEEFLNILNAYTSSDNSELNTTVLTSLHSKKVSKESILHCLEICFFTVCSKCTISLTPNMFKLYEDFVQRHSKSQHMEIRDRALKCGIAFSMLYQPLAKEIHEELYQQFVRHYQTRLWTTSVTGICEMFDRYGIDYFAYDTDSEKQDSHKSKKTRQLYNVSCDPDEQEESQDTGKNGTNVMYLFTHLFDNCQEATISMALATGFCRLILGGHYETSELISKIILKFFNPSTCTEINQILSVFFETLIQRGKQSCLERALLPTVFTILGAPHDSTLREIKAESVIKFVINSTVPSSLSSGSNIHNTIARSFINSMTENITNKELLKTLSKELQFVEVDENATLRNELKDLAKNLLEKSINDSKVEKYIKVFIEMLSGTRSRACNADDAGSDDDQSVDENVDKIDDNVQTGEIDSTSQQIVNDTRSNNSPVQKTQTTEISRTKDSDDIEIPQNDNVSSDEESFVSSASKSMTKTRGENKPTQSKTTTSKLNLIQNQSIENPDENENCRIVTSTQEQSDDEIIPNTPTASPIVPIRILRQETNSKGIKLKKLIPEKETSSNKSTKETLSQPSPKSNASTPRSKASTPKLKSTQERRKRHRLSQAHVRLERLNLNSLIAHRTRNALVAEFKEKNIMTRNRQSLDQIKSPTQRIEHLKKLTPNASKTTRTSQSKPSSPSVTPLPKRRSVSDRSSPISSNLKLLSEKSTSTTTATAMTAVPVTRTNVRQTTISKIPTRAATMITSSSSSSPRKRSIKATTTNSSRESSSSSQSQSRLPLRKSSRSSSQMSSRKK